MISFIEQMCENVKTSLIFPFHIKQEKLHYEDGNNLYFNPDYPDSYHEHSFENVLRVAYQQPYAFYLTKEDKKYYSEQERVLIDSVIKREIDLLNQGYKLMTLDMTEETEEMLQEYCAKNGFTMEEGVVDILKKIVTDPNILNTSD